MKKRFRTADEWKAILLDIEQTEGTTNAVMEKHSITSAMLSRARKRFGIKHARGDKRNIAKLTEAQPLSGRAERGNQIQAMLAQGKSVPEIAREMGMTQQGVFYHQKKLASPRAAPTSAGSPSSDITAAISLLRRAEKIALRLLRSGKIQTLDDAHLLTMQALRVLAGDQ